MSPHRPQRQAPQRRSRADWQEILSELHRSRLPLVDFARARGINVGRLRWWSWRLRHRPDADPRPVELVVRPQSPAPTVMVAEIQFADLVLRLHHASPAALADLIRELRARC